jgi:hypothetical protein
VCHFIPIIRLGRSRARQQTLLQPLPSSFPCIFILFKILIKNLISFILQEMSRQRRDHAAGAQNERWFREGVQTLLATPEEAQLPRRAANNVQVVVQAESQVVAGGVQAYSSLSLFSWPRPGPGEHPYFN